MSTAGRPGGASGRGPSAPRPSQRRRPSPAVYRRRRLAVGTLAVVVLGGVALGGSALARSVGGDPDDPATTSPSTSPSATVASPEPGGSPEPAPTTPAPTPRYTAGFQPTACADDDLAVTGSTSSDTYGVGGVVTFSLTLTNNGTVPCLVDGGTATVGVVVYSGEDRVWSSTDCPEGRTERQLLLDIGATEDVRIAWKQQRSAPGCPAEEATAEPGAYQALVTTDGGETTDESWQKLFLIS